MSSWHWIITVQIPLGEGRMRTVTLSGLTPQPVTNRRTTYDAVVGGVLSRLQLPADTPVIVLFFSLEPNEVTA